MPPEIPIPDGPRAPKDFLEQYENNMNDVGGPGTIEEFASAEDQKPGDLLRKYDATRLHQIAENIDNNRPTWIPEYSAEAAKFRAKQYSNLLGEMRHMLYGDGADLEKISLTIRDLAPTLGAPSSFITINIGKLSIMKPEEVRQIMNKIKEIKGFLEERATVKLAHEFSRDDLRRLIIRYDEIISNMRSHKREAGDLRKTITQMQSLLNYGAILVAGDEDRVRQ